MIADNQQERLDTQWIAGFVDGEGCFHVAINRQPKMKIGWQVLPEFRIVQHKRDIKILEQIQKVLGCGNVKVNHGDRLEVRIRGIENLNKIVNFFHENQLHTTKKYSFEIFSQIIELMNKGEHLNKQGLKRIAELASKMNRQTKRVYLESSETIRQTHELLRVKI